MASYLVSTPGNPSYSGRIFGIPFSNGRAFVSEQTVDPSLGWTPDQIAFSMKHDFGYNVMEVAAPANQPIPALNFPGHIPVEAVLAEAQKGIPVAKELPEAPAPAPEPEEGDGVVFQHESVLTTGTVDASNPAASEAPEFVEASPAPAEEPAPASTKKKRVARRKGAEDSEKSE